mmetsp:Transcript_11361/g.20131  ORF Transcript_11361/g.20131 Transcript_11361/m.20131 type:complete len:212 (-) Transcript_11361:41-676(-)
MEDASPSRKKAEIELMRQIDDVASQQVALSESLKERLSRIEVILEQGTVTSTKMMAPEGISPEEEADWWRCRIEELSALPSEDTMREPKTGCQSGQQLSAREQKLHGRTFRRQEGSTSMLPQPPTSPKPSVASRGKAPERSDSADRMTDVPAETNSGDLEQRSSELQTSGGYPSKQMYLDQRSKELQVLRAIYASSEDSDELPLPFLNGTF